MRFQYSLIVNTSLIDRYLTLIFGMYMGINDRNKVYQQAFWKKFVWANESILGPKMTHPHNSGSIVIFFFSILPSEMGQ